MPYEIYMDIKGYEGKYQVSNLGNIRNSKGKIMKQRKQNGGYMIIDLWKNGKGKTYLVHRLVLETFKANPRNCSDVNHIDENKENNSLNNLEWMTHRENLNHGTHNERMANSLKIKVHCIELNKTFDSALDALLYLGKDKTRCDIATCCKGKQKTAFGYHWSYADNSEDEE